MRSVRRLVLATLVVALIGAGCGGDDDGGGDDASSKTTEESTTTTTIDKEAAIDEITTNFVAVFNPQLTLDERVSYLEDGQELKQLVDEQYKILGPQATSASAQVDKVTLNDDGTANVEFQILLNGAPVVPTSGTAVLKDGKWLVSKATVCDLISLAGTTPDECADIASGG
jgi:hypothetical protein